MLLLRMLGAVRINLKYNGVYTFVTVFVLPRVSLAAEERRDALAFAKCKCSVKVSHRKEMMCLEQDIYCFLEENGRCSEKVFVAKNDVNPNLTQPNLIPL